MNTHKKNIFHHKALVTAMLVMTSSYSLGAYAALEEIIVTASKRATSLQDVAIAVTALQGDDLKNAGIDSQRTLAMMTPNISVNVNASFIAPYIRGVGTLYANPGLEPSVATYFNDLYLSRPSAGFMQFADVERVEVLKGPQGTLYGRNTTGGAIRIITKDPTQEFEGGVGFEVGNFGKVKADGYISGGLSDTVSARLSFQKDTRDGYVKNIVGGPDVEDRDLSMVHGKLLWEPNDKLRVKLDFDASKKDDYEGIGFAPLFTSLPEQVGAAFGGVVAQNPYEFSGDTPGASNQNGKNHFKARGSQLKVEYDFDSFTFSSITGYRYTEYSGVADLDGTNVPLFVANTLKDETKDYSQEFQLTSNTDGRLSWLAGLFFFKEEAIDNFGIGGVFIDGALGFSNAFTAGYGEIEIESFAPYGEVTYDLTDQLELMVGARYTDEKKTVENTFKVSVIDEHVIPIVDLLVAPTVSDEFEFSEVTPKVQLTWRPSDSTMYYASYSEGIKSGGFNMPNPALGLPAKVDNEVIKSFELGWKTQFDRLRFNGALFHYDLTDLQIQVTDLGGGITSVTNAGGADITGIEFDLTFAATDNLELGLGAGYQDTEFTDIPNGQLNPSCGGVPTCGALGGLGLNTLSGDISGNQLPQAPETSGYFRATYTLPLQSNGEVVFNLLTSYSDSFYYTADNLYEEPSKTLTNASATWTSADGSYLVSAYVTNLTDEVYTTHQAPFANSGGWRVWGPPRMYGVRFAVNF